jgi:hypothetical protein
MRCYRELAVVGLMSARFAGLPSYGQLNVWKKNPDHPSKAGPGITPLWRGVTVRTPSDNLIMLSVLETLPVEIRRIATELDQRGLVEVVDDRAPGESR